MKHVMDKPGLLLFDVNETLLDLQPLRPLFEQFLGDGRLMAEWFGLMLRLSLVATVISRYRPFDVLGREALATTAKKRGVSLSPAESEAILGQMRRLPPHSDVIPALTRLQLSGFRMAALTNSPPPALEAQLSFAGLSHFFERHLSVETVRLFKPAPETYQNAARELRIPLSTILMVAAHDWDISGAIRAGARAAFIARPGQFLGDSAEIPDIIALDLMALADRLTGT